MRIIITGGSGFIGSALVLHLLENTSHEVLNLDRLTYAANPASLTGVAGHPRYAFRQVDIRNPTEVHEAFAAFRPDAVMNLAAESHVDRSITASRDFIETNILGTHTLLEAARGRHAKAPHFRFHHISTDEVFGDLAPDDPKFTEETPYAPRSPYSSSKAASDHLVRAWGNTYGLPVVLTNCSNNYGPRQFPEKLIPHMILNAISGRSLPVYGDGGQIRDWLHVEDHVQALTLVLEKGIIGETYNIGGNHEMRNLDLVHLLCDLLDEMAPAQRGTLSSYRELITFVTDRPGHDRRYSVDTSKIGAELGWQPAHTFPSGLRETVRWYLDNESWWKPILSGKYQLERLGLGS